MNPELSTVVEAVNDYRETLEEKLTQIARERDRAIRQLSDETGRKHDAMEELIERQLHVPTTEYRGTVEDADPSALLTLEQKAADHWEPERADFDPRNVRFGALMLAQVDPSRVLKHLTPDEQKAFSVGAGGASGGCLVPSVVSGRFLDAIRNRTRVLAAGARTYPMRTGQNVSFPAGISRLRRPGTPRAARSLTAAERSLPGRSRRRWWQSARRSASSC